jgi:hypothetical protein
VDIILFLQEQPPEDTFVQFEIAFVVLLTIITGVAMVVDRIGNRVPYTVALALTFLPERLELDITKELILSLLVPPLVFEGALHISWERLKRNPIPMGDSPFASVNTGASTPLILPSCLEPSRSAGNAASQLLNPTKWRDKRHARWPVAPD